MLRTVEVYFVLLVLSGAVVCSWCNDIHRLEICTQLDSLNTEKMNPMEQRAGMSGNRFAVLGNTDSEWTTVVNRTRRRIAGKDSAEEKLSFEKMDVDTKLTVIFSKLMSIEESQKGMSQIHERLDSTCRQVGHIVDRVDTHTDVLKMLQYKSIDIEARQRRNNLIFRGLPESKRENCFDLVRNLIYEHLDLDSGDMYLERAHRLGKYRGKTRPVIVAFRDFDDTEVILSRTYRLKGTYFGIDRDYPYEIIEARKVLWPFFKKARQNRYVRASIKYPAKLVVDGKVVRDEFPDWYEVLNRSRTRPLPYMSVQQPRVASPPADRPQTPESAMSPGAGSQRCVFSIHCRRPQRCVIRSVR